MLSVKKIKNTAGFSLMEVIMTVFILMILILGIYGLILVSLKLTSDNKMYVEAVQIANQKMEKIRNMPYADVGVSGGSPNGLIPQEEIINANGIFTVNSYVGFQDDPYDGTLASSTDAIGNDYKIATIKVSWISRDEPKSISIFSKIVPRTEETADGYGLLKIYVVDSNSSPVPGADVHIINAEHSIDIVNPLGPTDSNGVLYFIAPESIEQYEISVTKAGYGTDQTYDSSTGLTPIHLTVTEGNKTEESFSIDLLATVNINTFTNNLPDNWMVNKATSTSLKSNSRIAADGSGNLYFAWHDTRPTSSSVYVQKFDSSDNAQWGNDLEISNTTYQLNPDIVSTASGNSYVVWQDNSVILKQTALAPAEIKLAGNKIEYVHPNKYDILITDSFFSTINYYKNVISNKLSKISTLLDFDHNLIKTIPQTFSINQTNAQVAGTIVQTKISSNVNWSSTMSATFDSPPTDGNVILAIAMRRNTGSFNVPTNATGSFTETIYSNSGWNLDVGIWHKVAGAAEPSQVTITANSFMTGGVLMLMEVSDLDTGNLVNVTSANDQTGGDSTTANTGSTAVTVDNAFAIAAIGFADNNYDTPNSANYFSSSGDNWTHYLWDDWSTGQDGSFAVSYLDVSSAASQRATLTLTGAGGEQRNSVIAVFRVSSPDSISLSEYGGQVANMMIPSVDQYTGGKFIITDDTSSHNISDITLTERGSVDALNSISNVRLYYDLDINAPYDCVDEQYDAGIDPQFGSAQSFDGSDGRVTFSEIFGVDIDTTRALCLYPVLDIGSGASKDQTLEIEISSPALDIVSDAGSTIPSSPVLLASTTILLSPADLQQAHYRFRADDGDEATASWLSSTDSPIDILTGEIFRLRLALSNEGSLDTSPTDLRLEYGEKVSNCNSIAVWNALPTDNSLHWKISNSSNITDADATTDSPDIPNENTNFVASEIKDTSNQASSLTLTSTDFSEIEFSIEATLNATDQTYCFRLTDAGAVGELNYIVYPEVTIIGDNNIYIKYIDSNGNELWATKKVNSSMVGANQINPKIALTENYGQATTTIFWEDEQNGNLDIYGQSLDASGNKQWGADLQITSSSTDEHSITVKIDANDNIYLAWVNLGDVYVQKYILNGTQLWTNHINVSNTINTEYYPMITIDNTGNFYLAWTEDNSSEFNIYLSKYDPSGTQLWKTQANVDDLSANQYYVDIATDNSYVYLVWTDSRKGNEDIYAQKIDLAGTVQWAKDQKLNNDPSILNQNTPSIVINSSGDSYAAWNDLRNGSSDIYAVGFSDPAAQIPKPNFPLYITGTKRISDTPIIYEYNKTQLTNGLGQATIQIEWDKDPGYSITASTTMTAFIVSQCDPACPFEVTPGEIKNINIYVE